MAIIISDSFNRADSATLGTSDTGQVWTTTQGNWGIFSSEARSVYPDTGGAALAIIEAGTTEVSAQTELVNISVWSEYSCDTGVIVRYLNNSYYYRYGLFKYHSDFYQLFLRRVYAGSTALVWQLELGSPPADGSIIKVECCGDDFDMYLNGVLQGSWNFASFYSPAIPRNYGTLCGLRANPGTVSLFGGNYQIVDDFLVTTVTDCPTSESYNCTGGVCVDPGDGTGTYATLAECLTACSVAESYDCVSQECVDPGDGSGAFATLLECEQSGCAGLQAQTYRFDAGNGSAYYLVASISDSGDELRSKTYKAVRHTGRRTNCSAMVYGYDVNQEISVGDLETGTRTNDRMTTGSQSFADSSGISQSKRKPVNIANAVLGTVRIEGNDTGNEERDQIHEVIVEQAEQGVRR